MDWITLKQAAEEIALPADTKHRIVKNCTVQLLNPEKYTMKHKKRTLLLRKPAAAATIALLCLILSATSLAFTGTRAGFFRDIQNIYGAIIGTSYEQAAEEIAMTASVCETTLTVSVHFTNPEKPPFEAETLRITEYQILDAEGTVVQTGFSPTPSTLTHGRTEIVIPLEEMRPGNDTLFVSAFGAEKKADQPMRVTGTWESSFTR